MAIYDTIQYIQTPVHPICVGQACSMGSLLLAAADEIQPNIGTVGGSRGCPAAHAVSLRHEAKQIELTNGGASGQATKIMINAK
ncbi:hypothetical protein BC830DRAFT_1168338 [Chytriomyces sp. MP71]|nr:hypothetical protein BC830DRAFT_1168338 [Chytriomyces sp. MP71]